MARRFSCRNRHASTPARAQTRSFGQPRTSKVHGDRSPRRASPVSATSLNWLSDILSFWGMPVHSALVMKPFWWDLICSGTKTLELRRKYPLRALKQAPAGRNCSRCRAQQTGRKAETARGNPGGARFDPCNGVQAATTRVI